ncbi:MAG: VWA domain-containing protein [Saprospiraceae bacterium]
MFRFEYTEHLYAFAIIPLLVLAFLWMWTMRKRAMDKIGEQPLLAQLMPKFSKYKHTLKFVLLMLALSTLIVAWANPQWGTKKEKVKRKSADIFIALDISTSMVAQDIRPNRLERAKQFGIKLIEAMRGERIGIIIFAGNAYLQMPLTTDYAAATLFLKSANTEMAPTQGTAISDAIDLAEQSFQRDNKHHKALVIITDGENHDQQALERMQEANSNGLLAFTVGVGTAEGAQIPVSIGAGRMDWKRDETGNPVVTKINEDMLRQLAQAGSGSYFNLLQGEEVLADLREKLEKVEKRELEQRSFSEYESYFAYFIAFAFLLILMEFLLSYQKSKLLEGKEFFN